ncbi:hypothetical protein ACOMHN_027343 [Nucella lapillus]
MIAEHKLVMAIGRNEGVERIRSLVQEGANIFSGSCYKGWTPLTLAAHLGRTETVEYLLECIQKASNQSTPQYLWGITVDSLNGMGHPALYCAARQGHIAVCRQLLDAGANVNLQCRKRTSLLVAVQEQRREVVTFLLENGADTHLTDGTGGVTLCAAVKANCCDLVRHLIDAGSDLNVSGYKYSSQTEAPIILAAREGFLSVVKVLVESGCYKDMTNKCGDTALYEAVTKGHNDVVQYLTEQGCDLNKCNMYEFTPLMTAVLHENLEAARLLVHAGACVKMRNYMGHCAGQLAVEMGSDQVLHFFLTWGMDVTRRPNLTFSEPGRVSCLTKVFEISAKNPKTVLVLLRGCPHLDLSRLSFIGAFRNEPALLELAFASGLSHPPTSFLAPKNVQNMSAECAEWVEQFRKVPLTLKQLCRSRVRRRLGNTVFHTAPTLPLPRRVTDYLVFSDAVLTADKQTDRR